MVCFVFLFFIFFVCSFFFLLRNSVKQLMNLVDKWIPHDTCFMLSSFLGDISAGEKKKRIIKKPNSIHQFFWSLCTFGIWFCRKTSLIESPSTTPRPRAETYCGGGTRYWCSSVQWSYVIQNPFTTKIGFHWIKTLHASKILWSEWRQTTLRRYGNERPILPHSPNDVYCEAHTSQ